MERPGASQRPVRAGALGCSLRVPWRPSHGTYAPRFLPPPSSDHAAAVALVKESSPTKCAGKEVSIAGKRRDSQLTRGGWAGGVQVLRMGSESTRPPRLGTLCIDVDGSDRRSTYVTSPANRQRTPMAQSTPKGQATPKKSDATSRVRGKQFSTQRLSNLAASFKQSQAAWEQEEAARQERNEFTMLVEAQLAAVNRGDQAPDEELLARAFRQADVDPSLRVRAGLGWAKGLRGRQRTAPHREVLEFAAEISRESQLLRQDPLAAVELAEVCTASLDLDEVAESIYMEMEGHALQLQPDMRHPYRYLLIDFAQRRKERGDLEKSHLLWKHACAVPDHARDPRCFTKYYAWRFDAEPRVPNDDFCVRATPSPRVTKPLSALQRPCVCNQHATQLGRPASAPTLARPSSSCGGRCASATRGDSELASTAATGPGHSPEDQGKHCCCSRTTPQECRQEDAADFGAVRRVMDQSFNISGGFVDLGHDGRALPGSPSQQGEAPCDAAPNERIKKAETSARRLVQARRFQLRFIRSDGSQVSAAELDRDSDEGLPDGGASRSSSDDSAESDLFFGGGPPGGPQVGKSVPALLALPPSPRINRPRPSALYAFT